MSDQEKFEIDERLRLHYEMTQYLFGELGWKELPTTLAGIGPIRRLDLTRNEGEKRTGAIRVFIDLPSDEEGARVLEAQFNPLDGTVGWWFHRRDRSSGMPEVRAVELAWPSSLPMQMALYRVAELLDQDTVAHGRFASWEIRRFLAGRPAGSGYPNLTFTAAKSLLRYRKASIAAMTPLEMEENAWYAVSRQRPYHETPEETLEFFIGRALRVARDVWYLREEDDLHLQIARGGRGAAAMAWSWNVVDLNVGLQVAYQKKGLAKFLTDGHGSWTFRLDARFAQSLKIFATEPFPESSTAVVQALLTP